MAHIRDLASGNPVLDFTSVPDLLDWLEANPPLSAWRANGQDGEFVSLCRSMGGMRDWYGTPDFPTAAKLAREGWPEGREKLARAAFEASRVTRLQLPPAARLDVAGAFPHVALAVAGEPECMWSMGEDRTAQQPVVDIWISSFLSAGTDANAYVNRGAALVAAIDAIENAGRRVALTTVQWTGPTDRIKSSPNRMLSSVELKHPDQPVDIDGLAFSLAHPSMTRRIMFAIYERCPGLVRSHETYGNPDVANTAPPTLPPGALYLPPLGVYSPAATACATPEGAVAWLNAQLVAGGILDGAEGAEAAP